MDRIANCFMTSIDNDAYNLFEIPNLTGTPERRLLVAVLERAVLDLVGNDEKEAKQAEEWLFGEADELENSAIVRSNPTVLSFDWICDQLDLDSVQISQKIKAMPKRGRCRVAPWHMARQQMLASCN